MLTFIPTRRCWTFFFTVVAPHWCLCYTFIHLMWIKVQYPFLFFFFFSPWWTELKWIHHGNVTEMRMFIGGNREKQVLMYALKGWTHNKMANDLLRYWETPQWQHDRREISLKTPIGRLEGRTERSRGNLRRGRETPVATELCQLYQLNSIS